jgi:oligopeptide/dipeptide ABC transporter ATP-binding protein
LVLEILKIEDLSVELPTSGGTLRAVDGLSLWVGPREVVGLVGESGSGKTMTALSVMRLIPPSARVGGRILFNQEDLQAMPKKKLNEIRGSKISMIFQDPMTFLNPVMKIGDQIGESLARHTELSKQEVHQEVLRLLEKVQLSPSQAIAESYPHELSGGMRQRVLIAIALSCKPALVIADEPTTALDMTTQAQILRVIIDLVKELGISMVLITHDLGIVAELCDRVYVMYAGRIVEEADTSSLFRAPKHPYTKGLVDSVLSVDKVVESFPTINGSVPNMILPPTGCRFHPRCPYKMEVCSEKTPPMVNIGGVKTACWLYGGNEKQ